MPHTSPGVSESLGTALTILSVPKVRVGDLDDGTPRLKLGVPQNVSHAVDRTHRDLVLLHQADDFITSAAGKPLPDKGMHLFRPAPRALSSLGG